MKLNYFSQFIKSIQKLTNNQLHLIQHRINEQVQRGGTSLMIDERKGGDVICPHCNCDEVGK